MAITRSSLESAAKKAAAKTIGALPGSAAKVLAGPRYEIDGNTFDPQLRLAMKGSFFDRPITEMSLEDARLSSAEGFATGNAPRVEGVTVTETILPDPVHGDLNARVYTPPDGLGAGEIQESRPAVLFLHQGVLIIGDLHTCDTFCTQLAAGLDAVVVSLDYLLVPEHPFPTQNDNVDAAWAWLNESAGHLGIDPQQLIVCGDSAGGQLTASLCQRLRDAGEPGPAVQALVYPFVDATSTGGSMESCASAWPLTIETSRHFMQYFDSDGFDPADPSFSPALHPNLADLPPAVVVTAGFDILRDQGRDYAIRLARAGVPVIERCETTLCHSFLALGGISTEAFDACERLVSDISTLLSEIGE